jgi:hypothetical protein|tara:strand:+ start:142 stop:651 length:510 start_codon:yes stop_codon:yes gene_type:complete
MSQRKKKSKKVPTGYDSKLEYDLHKNELKHLTYHPEERINYVTTHSYEPDFVTEICLDKDCSCAKGRRCTRTKTILVEVKGRFRERKEASKYIAVRESLSQEAQATGNEGQAKQKELIFLFQDADKPMPNAQRRKDGTKQSHGEWAEKNGFRFYCLKKGLPKKWLQELK